MPDRFDVFALAPRRDAKTIESFLQQWAPKGRHERGWLALGWSAKTLEEALSAGLSDAKLAFIVEIEPRDHKLPTLARVVFTRDGRLILGLSVDDDEPGDAALRFTRELMSAFQAAGFEKGLISQDDPPPETAEHFAKLIADLASKGESSAYFAL